MYRYKVGPISLLPFLSFGIWFLKEIEISFFSFFPILLERREDASLFFPYIDIFGFEKSA